MPVPFHQDVIKIGVDRLKRMQQKCNIPLGLENHALAFSIEDVNNQAKIIQKILSEINGFLLLDLHNLYCQSYNFNVKINYLIQLYPLELVREIHISGGSFHLAKKDGKLLIRRDTHDHFVPDEVFNALEDVIFKCSNLKFVVLEQVGSSLRTQALKEVFQNDFLKLKAILNKCENVHKPNNQFLPKLDSNLKKEPFESSQISELQNELVKELEKNIISYDTIISNQIISKY